MKYLLINVMHLVNIHKENVVIGIYFGIIKYIKITVHRIIYK